MKGLKRPKVDAFFYQTSVLLQLFSEKCTGRYLKVTGDDLSSKQGSFCTFKMILFRKYLKYIFTYNYIFINENIIFFFVNSMDKYTDETAFAATFG